MKVTAGPPAGGPGPGISSALAAAAAAAARAATVTGGDSVRLAGAGPPAQWQWPVQVVQSRVFAGRGGPALAVTGSDSVGH